METNGDEQQPASSTSGDEKEPDAQKLLKAASSCRNERQYSFLSIITMRGLGQETDGAGDGYRWMEKGKES